jgi:hypothetical protein
VDDEADEVPFPKRPLLLLPQQYTSFVDDNAHVCAFPVPTATTVPIDEMVTGESALTLSAFPN